MKARRRLAEWSNTPEGKAHYEKVANEMREQMTNQEIDKWVEGHIVVPPDDEISEARRLIYADIVPSIIEWGKRIAHKFYKLGKQSKEHVSEDLDEAAKKDLSLTIDDIEKIHTFLYAVKNNKSGVFTFTRLSDEQYEEVLRRFQKAKEGKK